VVTPVSIIKESDLTDEIIIKEYLKLINQGFYQKSSIVHLGKRSREAKFLKNIIDRRNIDWFKDKFGGESWRELVVNARKVSYDKAFDILKRKSNLKGAKEEMERALSARAANAEYYGLNDEGINELRKTQQIVFDSMRKPKLNLESAAFIMMIDKEDE
jgi:ATP-dependent helicase HepA